ncbi:hypothetical protein OJAV_G00070510 [Oryzias javanicus]|uniref:Peptidase M20 domain-containing protein 2 n=1 Tax=Oryzias javanicus TaxID=123683 RepID=A0A3S2MA29_ORYJA|nr:hypothetical protein OJAV_G00070510 [Oryzias javanicus]
MSELQLKQRVSSCIDDAKAKLHSLSRDIWRCPELAYQEVRSHDRLVAFFHQEEGWQVDSRFKLDTAFRACWRSAGVAQGHEVSLAFLCEYDALPGIGHACGHNLIAEVGAAAAVGLKAALEDERKLPVQVKVTVLGTPAEEEGGGKVDMLRDGAFEGLDVVFMAHPSKEDATYLPCVSEQDVTVKYHGKAAHASAYPWKGINALDAAVLCYNNLSALRQQMRPDWRVHGIIKNGGVKPNIIPDYTELEYYLRTPSRTELPVLKAKAESCFRSAAMATGCEVEIEFTRNQYDNILHVLKNESGSTDFGNVTFAVPGIHPYFYIGSDALNHTDEYRAAAGDERAQLFALRVAKALAMTAVDLILHPELLQKVKQEFTEARRREDKR